MLLSQNHEGGRFAWEDKKGFAGPSNILGVTNLEKVTNVVNYFSFLVLESIIKWGSSARGPHI